MIKQALFLAITILLAPSCGGSDDSDDGNNPPPPPPASVALDDYPAALFQATCDRRVRCGDFADADTCQTVLRAPRLGDVVNAVGAGTILYDEELAVECLEAIASDVSCDTSSRSARVTPAACEGVFTGGVNDGAACAIDEQCVSGYCDYGSCQDECCPGTCAAMPGEGDACPLGQCGDDLYCDAAAGTCARLLAVDAECTSNGQCDYGLFCGFNMDSSRACHALPQQGDTCEFGLCNPIGLGCNAATDTCEPVQFDDATCDATTAPCSLAYLRCDEATSTCVPFPAVGQPCINFRCDAGAFCERDPMDAMDPGVCQEKKPNGGTCASSSECTSGFCTDAGACADAPTCVSA